MNATIQMRDLPDGRIQAIIEYEDGHTVRMEVAPDSPVLAMHLGLDPGLDTVPV